MSALSVGIQRLHEEGRPGLVKSFDQEVLGTFLGERLPNGAIILTAVDPAAKRRGIGQHFSTQQPLSGR